MQSSFAAYPPIEAHGVIGDRRTAALVAADGTISWWCLPNYDGVSVFGAAIDADRGGWWRIGPVSPVLGKQSYVRRTAILVTVWDSGLELTDAMIWPEDDRPPADESHRVVVRRVRAARGAVSCVMALAPRLDFNTRPAIVADGDGFRFDFPDVVLGLWASVPLFTGGGVARTEFNIAPGEDVWFVLGLNENPRTWSPERAQVALQATADYWREWDRKIAYTGPRPEQVRRSAQTIHLLSFAPSGAMVAAPTASLPERIGGNRNYDYRFAWVRDASLSMAILAMLGNVDDAARYMDWLAGLGTASEMPLQVLYRIDGGTDVTQAARNELSGYRESRPVLFGNHAFAQVQGDSLGYLADCSLVYLEHGGRWKPEYTALIQQLADYTIAHWREPDNGIWELTYKQHYVSSKVMAWVALQRSCKIVAKVGAAIDTARWQAEMAEIHSDVMNRGWSDRVQSFRQRYESEDALDASILLIPIMGFLPAEHPRVTSTLRRIVTDLTRDHLVYRFSPDALLDADNMVLGEFEGAFLPCTYWLAAALAMAGDADTAETIVNRVEQIAGELGLLAEEADRQANTFLGNTPLLFSHAEHLRAVTEIAKARPLQKAAMMFGQGIALARRLVRGNGLKAMDGGAHRSSPRG